MAKKVFDILPPRKKEHHYSRVSRIKKEKKKRGKTFWSLIFGLFLIIVIWLLVHPVKNNVSNGVNSKENNFELFNPEGNSALTQSPVKVQIINASSGTVDYQDIANMLIKQGFTIQKTGEEENSRAETIIYYHSNHLKDAQKAKNILNTKFITTLQEKNDLDQNIDLSIVIGKPK